ncbi:MAG: hypothetical protein A2096_17445 [Spirochaetes bacterium GWF1_41_5]|nr:MAG: hypothetical protein A2096_17445 [Spirochaetes bacterium GWF1_41_5]
MIENHYHTALTKYSFKKMKSGNLSFPVPAHCILYTTKPRSCPSKLRASPAGYSRKPNFVRFVKDSADKIIALRVIINLRINIAAQAHAIALSIVEPDTGAGILSRQAFLYCLRSHKSAGQDSNLLLCAQIKPIRPSVQIRNTSAFL